MAHYVRFEIYIPVVYTTEERDPSTGGIRKVKHAMDANLVARLITEASRKYRGVTQANPIAPAAYKGWWKEKKRSPVDIDYLTYIFGLVQIDEAHAAEKFFETWKETIEGAENQKYVLVIYYPVNTIGDFF